ncbi:hypothetical protein ACVWYT_007518 [Streptomyces sp. TE4109]
MPALASVAADSMVPELVAISWLKTASGFVSLTVTSSGPVMSIDFTLRNVFSHALPTAGSMWRRREATTSFAVRTVPSWKRTPGRIL